MNFLGKYTDWLHTQWPAGKVEKLPEIQEDGSTSIQGIRIVGDLTGIPLLKFASDTGAKAVQAILSEESFKASQNEGDEIFDIAIIGGGVSGYAAAIEAKKHNLHVALFEASQSFSTIKGFPKSKPIFTYPTEMKPSGKIQFKSSTKEELLEELNSYKQESDIEPILERIEKIVNVSGDFVLQAENDKSYKARRVIIAIGRSGNYRKLNVPGENLDKVSNRLYDPKDFKDKDVLIVGGGDSALESAIALVHEGAKVILSYRKKKFSRPKQEIADEVERLAKDSEPSFTLMMSSQVKSIESDSVTLLNANNELVQMNNDQVFTLIGREAPLDFFRRSGIRLTTEWTTRTWINLAISFLFVLFFYHWQKGMWFTKSLNPEPLGNFISSLGGILFEQSQTHGHFLNALKGAMSQAGFYYSFAYCICVVAFGIRRVKRRKTPYVKIQTITLAAFQIIPLFLLPWILLPWMGANEIFEQGLGKLIADWFWPNGEYWRAFGLVLAWPLFVYNWFTDAPLWGWLILGFLQTFVIIPLLVRRWGKGAYCGWICSCGALAETLGDAHRHKMPHGPAWNKLNMLGQSILWIALIMMLFRIVGWIFPGSVFNQMFQSMFSGGWRFLNYKYLVDFWLAGVLGIAFYFHLSGRVWCRFACPLAALMHIYARFSNFRIFSNKKKCISCNVCTSVCHQGIDVMNFANKGIPMEDPECVRCSACVQSCPTGVLSFGRYSDDDQIILDKIAASQVQMQEAKKSLK